MDRSDADGSSRFEQVVTARSIAATSVPGSRYGLTQYDRPMHSYDH